MANGPPMTAPRPCRISTLRTAKERFSGLAFSVDGAPRRPGLHIEAARPGRGGLSRAVRQSSGVESSLTTKASGGSARKTARRSSARSMPRPCEPRQSAIVTHGSRTGRVTSSASSRVLRCRRSTVARGNFAGRLMITRTNQRGSSSSSSTSTRASAPMRTDSRTGASAAAAQSWRAAPLRPATRGA